MKLRILAGALAVSAVSVVLTGCAHQMSDEDIDTVREMACGLQDSYARSADIAIRDLNPGKFWAIGPKIADYSETLAISGRMGPVADAYADFAGMFPEKLSDAGGVTQDDVDTFNAHIASIASACEGNPGYEEPRVVVYPEDPEDQAYLLNG